MTRVLITGCGCNKATEKARIGFLSKTVFQCPWCKRLIKIYGQEQRLLNRPKYETLGGEGEELVIIRGYVYIHSVSRYYDKGQLRHRFYPTGIAALPGYTFPRRVVSERSTYEYVMDSKGIEWAYLDGVQTAADTTLSYTERI